MAISMAQQQVTPYYNPPHEGLNWQDVAGMATIAVPLILMVGFFFTLKAKAAESEREIKTLAAEMEKSISRLNELLLLKIDAKLGIIMEKFEYLKIEQDEQKQEIQRINELIERQKEANHEILTQLSAMGIDLYVIGENDRRKHPRSS